jgi:hypothetical protein
MDSRGSRRNVRYISLMRQQLHRRLGVAVEQPRLVNAAMLRDLAPV